VNRGESFIDVSFVSEEGDLHWVIYDDLAGSYQYFVNRALGDISILRSLFRLDPARFPNGRTYLKNEPLPSFESILNATKVQDETFETSDGTYITKYDWSNYVRERDFNGVYGPSTGSWYIHPSTDYFSGNHLKQTLTVSSDILLACLGDCILTAVGPSGKQYRRRCAAECCARHFTLSDSGHDFSTCWKDMGSVAMVSCKFSAE
jgi:hypothetical protein